MGYGMDEDWGGLADDQMADKAEDCACESNFNSRIGLVLECASRYCSRHYRKAFSDQAYCWHCWGESE